MDKPKYNQNSPVIQPFFTSKSGSADCRLWTADCRLLDKLYRTLSSYSDLYRVFNRSFRDHRQVPAAAGASQFPRQRPVLIEVNCLAHHPALHQREHSHLGLKRSTVPTPQPVNVAGKDRRPNPIRSLGKRPGPLGGNIRFIQHVEPPGQQLET